MVSERIILYFAAVAVLLIISGCVGAPPGVTPAPTETATPLPTALAPTPAPQPASTPAAGTPSPAATPSVIPAIRVASYPASVNGEDNFTIQWEVSGGMSGDISHTAVHWGYSSVTISNYTRESKVQTGKTPQMFSTELKAPAGGDYIYFRVHAIVDGAESYSNEYQIAINPRYTGGGGY